MHLLHSFLALATAVSAVSLSSFDLLRPQEHGQESDRQLKPRQACDNTATSRDCWGEYSIDTDYYTTIPDTGVTREYWLSVERVDCAPDGYNTTCLTFNGTVPGPTIFADWGDTLVIHVTNNVPDNGTSIHWHGLRQLNTVAHDGVSGVTQCPIAPNESLTHTFRVTQYGSTWYHSHHSLQYADGLFGGMILNGPATADYDEDLGLLFLSDWHHTSVFALWGQASQGAPPTLESGLVNGTNTYNCTYSGDATCEGVLGSKYETVFASGTRYLIRLVNVAVDGHFRFSIDGHRLTVVAMDLVPIVPYETDSVRVAIGQRYDVIVEANADAGDYWLRAGWNSACATNLNPDDMTGIVRYDAASTADPTSESDIAEDSSCGDEDAANLVPYLSLDVGSITSTTEQDVGFEFTDYFKWTINGSSLYLNWSDPTLYQLMNGDNIFPTEYNVVSIGSSSNSTSEYAMLVIQDSSGFGITHPIHLHGHDFWVLAQETGMYNDNSVTLNTANPPRRDVASLPGNGYLAIAFRLDNPGTWLVHCHIAWHASQGFSLEFVEAEGSITTQSMASGDSELVSDTCSSWWAYDEIHPQEDSGI